MTQYGPVYEFWFDGATAAGNSEPYNFAAWYDLIHHLAPNAVIGLGNVRWVGNENGYARDSEWSVIPLEHDYNIQPSGDLTGTDLGSRAHLFDPGVHYSSPGTRAEVNF